MDCIVVPTIRFHILYLWFVIDHGQRQIIRFDVTPNPTAQWVVQQLREPFPDDSAPRFLLHDTTPSAFIL